MTHFVRILVFAAQWTCSCLAQKRPYNGFNVRRSAKLWSLATKVDAEVSMGMKLFQIFRTKERQDDTPSEWRILMKALSKRLISPFGQPSYVFFFLASMMIGATGVWVAVAEAWLTLAAPSQTGIPQVTPSSIWQDPSVAKSILTFFAGLGSLSCMQIIVVEDTQKNLRSFAIVLLLAIIFLAIMAALKDHVSQGDGFIYLISGTIIAVLTWWIANWDDGKYSQVPAVEALGGELDDAVAGDNGGFKL